MTMDPQDVSARDSAPARFRVGDRVFYEGAGWTHPSARRDLCPECSAANAPQAGARQRDQPRRNP